MHVWHNLPDNVFVAQTSNRLFQELTVHCKCCFLQQMKCDYKNYMNKYTQREALNKLYSSDPPGEAV